MKKKNRVLTKLASVLGLAFASAAALEWSGYEIFNDAKGGNALCAIDPTCRPLTPGEIEMAREVFGDSINYAKVRYFNRNYMWFFGDGSGISPNGHIYIRESQKISRDYSVLSNDQRKLFIHEMAHVWQNQGGTNVRREALSLLIKHRFNYKASYDYTLDQHPRYSSYNLEQQADIAEDYYGARQEFRASQVPMALPFYESMQFSNVRLLFEAPSPEQNRFACENLFRYEEKLSQAMPVTPEAGCDDFRPKKQKAEKTVRPS